MAAFVRPLIARPWLTGVLLFAVTVAIAATVSCLRTPLPKDHDEFSNLLLADTLLEGRFANPTPLHWRHFETIHVIQQPSYASKYQPGPGIVLAVGELLGNRAIVGVWLLSGCLTFVIYWMLQGFLSTQWSAAGGLFVALHPNLHMLWGQAFYVEALAMVGGALVIGAVPRLGSLVSTRETPLDKATTRGKTRASLLMASGAIILAISRPYEGLALCLVTGIWLAAKWARTKPHFRNVASQVVQPFGCVFIAGAVGLMTYNHAVTGHATLMPYQIHEATYGMCPLFLWQQPKAPDYHHPDVGAYHNFCTTKFYWSQQSWAGMALVKWTSITSAFGFFFPKPAGFLLCALPFFWRGKMAPVVCCTLVMGIVSLLCVFTSPRYLAPAAPFAILLFVYVWRGLTVAFSRRFNGYNIAPIVVALQIVAFGLGLYHHVRFVERKHGMRRAAVTQFLEAHSGQHLVLVSYGDDHLVHDEWVYNDADLPTAKIIWARTFGDERDIALIESYPNRTCWTLDGDADVPQPRQLASRTNVPIIGSASSVVGRRVTRAQ